MFLYLKHSYLEKKVKESDNIHRYIQEAFFKVYYHKTCEKMDPNESQALQEIVAPPIKMCRFNIKIHNFANKFLLVFWFS